MQSLQKKRRVLMKMIWKMVPGLAMALVIAAAAKGLEYLEGLAGLHLIGASVIALFIGMVINRFFKPNAVTSPGIRFTSKKVLKLAIILLGASLNIMTVLKVGRFSLTVMLFTLATCFGVGYFIGKALGLNWKMSNLISAGTGICGGSAIAATAPVIGADDDEVAQAISVIFLFNVIAALVFPALGHTIGFDTASGEAFGIFAGTAVNDTSSVTAAASTWDSMWYLGNQTLDKAVTVKLTRTLAIIPITLVLALVNAGNASGSGKFSLKRAFPMFILWFICASAVTTISVHFGVSESFFAPLKEISKFLIVMAMAAVGLGSNVIKLVKSGGKPLLLGACCWVGITAMSLVMQHIMGLW